MTALNKSIICLAVFASYWTLAVVNTANAVIGGRPVQANEWRSTLIFKTATGACTATIVGRRVVLTAAQCINSGSGQLLEFNSGAYQLLCDAHPRYHADQGLDFALCSLDREIIGVPERVDISGARVSIGALVHLVGYGCAQVGGLEAGVGQLLSGDARVTSVSRSGIIVAAGATLCYGDAGGGVYAISDGRRNVVGVGSRGDLASNTTIAPTARPEFFIWARNWSEQRGVKICGFDGDSGCDASDEGRSVQASRSYDTVRAFTKEIPQRLISGLPSISLPEFEKIGDVVSQLSEVVINSKVTKVAPRQDETLEKIWKRLCGTPLDNDIAEQFEKYNSAIGTNLTRETIFKSEMEISVPLCPSQFRVQTREVKADDTVWKYYSDILALKRSPKWKDFRRPSSLADAKERSQYFVDAFSALNPDVSNIDRLGDGSKIKTVRVPVTPLSLDNATTLVAAGPKTVEPVFALQAGHGNCTAVKDYSKYPYDVGALLDVLRGNKTVEKGARRWVPVLVADSGLFGVGPYGVFTSDILSRSPGVAFDIKFISGVEPVTFGPEPLHGTQVASLVLGGPLFAQFQSTWETRIKIAPVRIYIKNAAGGQEWFGTENDVFDIIVEQARAVSAQIINLSLKTRTRPIALEKELAATSQYLFVVAAGNEDGHIGVSGKTDIYPALYGGTGLGAHNLIAVTAVDETKQLPDFANFGSDWIEIAAPGCGVPALSYDHQERSWQTRMLNGTSMATPLVAFAAAIVKSEFPDGIKAADTKRRILVSADLEPALASKVMDGRVLNVIKAASVHRDVIELPNKSILFGRAIFSMSGNPLESDQSFYAECGGDKIAIAIRDVLKIRPGFRVREGKSYAKVYLRGVGGQLLLNKECLMPSDLSVFFKDEMSESQQRFDMDQFRDFVSKVQ